MKKYLVVLLLISTVGFAQNLNSYKYAMVSSKFSFLKEDNMYGLNALAKMYMQKYDFETYFDNEAAPNDFIENNCNKIFVDVLSDGNLFTTKLKVVVKDCKGTILFTSPEGKSVEKEYKVAYNLALRDAFDNFGILKSHKYSESIKKEDVGQKMELVTSIQLFAQPVVNGFQLVDKEPKVVFKIYKTSIKDCFIAVKENQQGVLLTKENAWFFEYYKEGKLYSEQIDVKF